MSNWTLHTGDCRQVLARLDESSVDACVTDPPYELGFMGKKWDASGVAFDVEMWRAVLRVLKPGAHLLAFSGTRTYHRMVCAIEDAGFEIRDQIDWIYGTGFPKSLNVAKAIEDGGGPESIRRLNMGDDYAPSGSGRVNYDHGAGSAMNGSAAEPVLSAAATHWEGWGTALKPGHEPIVMARKPLDGTVAANVQKWGTGAINIDGCRVGESKRVPSSLSNAGIHGWSTGSADNDGKNPNVGRWPANVILDEDAAAELDAQSGISTSQGGSSLGGGRTFVNDGEVGASPLCRLRGQPGVKPGLGDTGGASRFFYVAKPTRKERDAGLDHIAAKSAGEATDRKDGSAGLNSPRAGAGRTSGARNHHPTVKPVELMRYLVRMVTPPNGLVLDPFTGSGTTGIATLQEGFRFVGIDLEPEYARIAIARIEEDAPLFNRRRGA